jgi:NDP-sugar pyrophosphorylase family protein
MLLTAGVGRRMRPLTLSQPKPAVPVLGRPLVVQTLHWLGTEGVTEAVLNLHHLPGGIRSILGEGKNPGLPEVHYSHEDTLLGTAGGIRKAGPRLGGDGPIVVSNSDFLSDIDLSAALDAHLASDCLATLVLAPWRPPYTVVLRDGDRRIVSLGNEPPPGSTPADGRWLFTGCHIMDEEVLDLIPGDGPSCIVRDVYRGLAARGRLGSYAHHGFWWEFGSPELYLDGCLRLLDRPREELGRISSDHDPVRRVGDATAAIGPGAIHHEDAELAGRLALGLSCYVSTGCRIEDSVVMPEAWLGPRCRLNRSIVGQGVELPAGFHSEDEMICPDPDPTRDLAPSTRREAGLLVYSFATAEAG